MGIAVAWTFLVSVEFASVDMVCLTTIREKFISYVEQEMIRTMKDLKRAVTIGTIQPSGVVFKYLDAYESAATRRAASLPLAATSQDSSSVLSAFPSKESVGLKVRSIPILAVVSRCYDYLAWHLDLNAGPRDSHKDAELSANL